MSLSTILPSGEARRPVLLLALGAFALGTDAYVISGVLPKVGQDLGVGIGVAGQLITVFSAVYALSAPVLAVLTSHVKRKQLLLAALTAFSLANVLAAVAPDYGVLIAARVLAALAAATYMPSATAAAATIAVPQERGRALAAVLGGLTVANAVGVPLGTFVGQSSGWRATFVFVAAVGAISVLGIAATLKAVASPPVASLAQRIAVGRKRAVPSTLIATALGMAGIFVIFSYLAWFAQHTVNVTGRGLSIVYLVIGVTAVFSSSAAGWLIDHMPPVRVGSIGLGGLALTSLALAGVAHWGGGAVLLCVVLGVWSLIGWIFNPAQQQRLFGLAPGPLGPIALSLNSSAIYAGQALASGLGALALTSGPTTLALVATGAVVLAWITMYFSAWRAATAPAAAAAPQQAPAVAGPGASTGAGAGTGASTG